MKSNTPSQPDFLLNETGELDHVRFAELRLGSTDDSKRESWTDQRLPFERQSGINFISQKVLSSNMNVLEIDATTLVIAVGFVSTIVVAATAKVSSFSNSFRYSMSLFAIAFLLLLVRTVRVDNRIVAAEQLMTGTFALAALIIILGIYFGVKSATAANG